MSSAAGAVVTGGLGSLLEGTRGPGGRVVWLDSGAYARRLFAPGEDVWVDVGPYVELARQSQRLLGSDVVEVRLGDFHRAALGRDPASTGPLREGRLLRALRRLLEDADATRTAADVVAALHGLYPVTPIVLRVEGAGHWLRWLAEATGRSGSVDPDDIDGASVYLADALRPFASAGISALALDVAGEESPAVEELLGLHRPLVNLAAHYGWTTVIRADERQLPGTAALEGVDVVVCPGASFTTVTEFGGRPQCGGGLDTAFWTAEECPEIPDHILGYGEIPPDAHPERVLSRLSALRARS